MTDTKTLKSSSSTAVLDDGAVEELDFLALMCERQRVLDDEELSAAERTDAVMALCDKLLQLMQRDEMDCDLYIERLYDYADFALKYGREEKAKELLVQVIKILKAEEGSVEGNLLRLADAYERIAVVYRELREFGRALRCLDMAREIYGESVGLSLAAIINSIAMVYFSMQKYADAEDYYSSSLAMYTELLEEAGDEEQNFVNENIAILYNNIGVVNECRGKGDVALDFFARSYSLRKRVLGECHPDIAESLNNIGNIYFSKINHSKAMRYYKLALSIYSHSLAPSDMRLAKCCCNIAAVYAYRGMVKQALDYNLRALDVYINLYGVASVRCKEMFANIKILEEAIYKR